MSVAAKAHDGRSAIQTNGATAPVLCAIYTRKSTDENLQGDFTTLDNQVEYCRSFIKTREPQGWSAYPEVYCDAGFSGKNIERPALQKLLADAQRGRFKVVVCYKYDRLTRNTRDFLEILSLFEERGIDFVSVTQPIDTTSPVGRLMRSILMEFAQFEREMIAERTRDKLAAMIRKGKWTGGPPPLGYDLDRQTKKLAVNEREAEIIRTVFKTYLECGSLNAAALALNARGYRMKESVNKEGNKRGGGRFYRTNLGYLIKNPIYIGKRALKGELYQGEHAAILDGDIFQRAQILMEQNHVTRNALTRDKHEFLLRGLVRCASCGSVMIPHFSRSRYGKSHLYYRCAAVNRTNKDACPVRAVRARALERFVLEQIKVVAQDAGLIEKLVRSSTEEAEELPGLLQDKTQIAAELGRMEGDIQVAMSGLRESGEGTPRRLLILQELDRLAVRQQELRVKLAQVEGRIIEIETRHVDVGLFQRNLDAFGQIFERLTHLQQKEFIRLVVKEIVYDKPQSLVRLGLIPFQGFEWSIDRFSLRFDPMTKWLRD